MCPEEGRKSSNLGPGARRRAAEKRHLDPLMLGTVASTLSLISRAKGIPQDGFRYRSDKVQSVGYKM